MSLPFLINISRNFQYKICNYLVLEVFVYTGSEDAGMLHIPAAVDYLILNRPMAFLVDDIGAGYDVMGKERSFLREKMHQYWDGNSCRRILEVLKIIGE